MMAPEALADELRDRGVVILAVTPHPSAPDTYVVYLHGNAGQWADRTALRRASRVPGVTSVIESELTSTILLVRWANGCANGTG